MRYLVESYLPLAGAEGRAEVKARARTGADELARAGARIRHLDCIFVPADEMCLVMYEAASPQLVRDACRRAGIDCERVLEAAGGPEVRSRASKEESP